MDRRNAIIVSGAAALLIVGTLAGRSMGQADAEATSSYSQAATDQRVRALEAQQKVLEGDLAKAIADRDALAKQLAGSGPTVDLGGAVGTAQKEYAALKAKLASAEEEARAAAANGKAMLAKAQSDAKAQTQKLQQEVAKLREENRKLRSDVESLGQKVDALNTTIKGLEGSGFKNPFGR